ncbi:MAG: hypothetical protein QXY26_10395 [Ignisphaera sp.]
MHSVTENIDKALEVIGEYLAAFLAVEQDWSVIDGMMHARNINEVLMYYDTALRSIHRVLDKRGGWIYNNLKRSLKEEINLNTMIDEYSREIMKLLESQNSRLYALKLIERALAKYPKYKEYSEERQGEEQQR